MPLNRNSHRILEKRFFYSAPFALFRFQISNAVLLLLLLFIFIFLITPLHLFYRFHSPIVIAFRFVLHSHSNHHSNAHNSLLLIVVAIPTVSCQHIEWSHSIWSHFWLDCRILNPFCFVLLITPSHLIRFYNCFPVLASGTL